MNNIHLPTPILVKKILVKKMPSSYEGYDFVRSKANMPFIRSKHCAKFLYSLSFCFIAQLYLHDSAFAVENSPLPVDLDSDDSTNKPINESADTSKNRTQQNNSVELEEALIALKLKRAVEQGMIDPSVLEDYQRETLSTPASRANSLKSNTQKTDKISLPDNSSDSFEEQDRFNSNDQNKDQNKDLKYRGLNPNTAKENNQNIGENDIFDNPTSRDNDDLLDNLGFNNNSNIKSSPNFKSDTTLTSPTQIDRVLGDIEQQVPTTFDAPVARLDSVEPPLGFDTNLDSSSQINPSNRETLGLSEDKEVTNEQGQSTSGLDPKSQGNPNNLGASNAGTNENLQNPVEGNQAVDDNFDDASSDDESSEAGINPDDYLPEYETSTDNNVDTSNIDPRSKQEDKSTSAQPGFFKRIYNRLFNDGYAALPKISAKVYLQQNSNSTDAVQSKVRLKNAPLTNLIEAEKNTQPATNIKAAMENITVESIVDFTAVTPKLVQEALSAAQAVGYYDIKLRFVKVDTDEVAVIIEHLGDPVEVNSRIIDIRGEGAELEEFQEIVESAPPDLDDTFNHGIYKNTKANIEVTSEKFGFFDGQWLNKSVDIILPDNTADVDLIYDTGERYHFDEVVFFTIDPETGQLTTDPDKLPVKPEILHQLHEFKAGDKYYGPSVTNFTNDLSATRYFNSVNVETILPGSGSGTLGFDNVSNEASDPNKENLNQDNLNQDNLNQGNPNQGNPNQDNLTASQVDHSVNQTAQNNETDLATDTGSSADVDSNANSESVMADIFNAGADGKDTADKDFQPIEYTVDQQTSEKLQEITAKAERLSRLPDDRVLDESEEEAKSLLGKVSNAISNAVEKVFPDDKDPLSDTNTLPTDLSETVLANRKTPEQVAETKSVPLYVFVMADKPKDVDLGIGYGTDTGVRTVARLEHNLINREGYQAGVSVGVSDINQSVNVHASRPWKHPLDDTLTGNISYEQEKINQGEGNLDLETRTIQAGISRNIHSDTGWNRTYSIRYRQDDLESGVTGPDRANLPVPFNREGASFEQEALLIGYKLDKTKADNVVNPIKGLRQYYSVEAGSASALTDTDMAIARAGVSGVYSFGEMNKHQVVGSLDAGYIWADDFENVPYKLRFFAGGDRSIRGYDYNSLSALDKGYLVGGQVLAVGSTEYNYEFKPGLRGAVFADFGNAYDTSFETETKLGVGVGVRWASPVGMVRLDLAAGVLEESVPVRLHFFIGSPLQ